MHRVKHRAKYNAWYPDRHTDDGFLRKAFAKRRATSPTRDNADTRLEAAVFRRHTDAAETHGHDASAGESSVEKSSEADSGLLERQRRTITNSEIQTNGKDAAGPPDMIETIRLVVAKETDSLPSAINESTNLRDVGVDSPTALRVVQRLNEEYDVELDFDEFIQCPTLGHLRKALGMDHESLARLAEIERFQKLQGPVQVQEIDESVVKGDGREKKKKWNFFGQQHELSLPSKPTEQRFTPMSQLRATIFNSWLNLMFVFVLIGFIVNYLSLDARIVFAMNFLAIIPSAAMVSFAVEDIGLRTGDLIGALLNMSFSNATQLISSILLLRSRQITVLKTSLLGSIISNLLLMLGLCMFAGGLNRIEQAFNMTIVQTISMMLLLAVLSILVPTTSHILADVSHQQIVIQSRGTSIVVIVSYGLYLFFQLKTHSVMFNAPRPENPYRPRQPVKKLAERVRGSGSRLTRQIIPSKRPTITNDNTSDHDASDDEDETEQPQLSLPIALIVLILSTVIVAFNAEFATNSIQTMVTQSKTLTQTFVGFVILPFLSNDPAAIINAYNDKMDLAIALSLERCMQTALLVIPLVVIVAWPLGIDEMTLEFDGFSVAATFASILIVNYCIQDGKSHWLEGAMLIQVYVIVALAAYFVQS